ncbi:hypothetical protein HPB47_017372, partial [Ixodes persulcatus]
VKTKHLLLAFDRHKLPALVKAGYLNCRVRPYVPNPQRCLHCQRFGHRSRSCRGRKTCAKCGSHDHVADFCEGSVACANCKGPHPAYSRSCPLWRQEKEILSLRAKENLSYPEAKQRFSFISKGTYSDAVRRGPAPRTESRATQFSLDYLAGPSQASKQPAGKRGAPGNAGSTQLPQPIQARPPADRQPRAIGSSQDGERGHRSTPSEAARLVTEQQGPPAAPSTSKNVESVNPGGLLQRGLAGAGKLWLKSPTTLELANLRPRFRMKWELLTLPILQVLPRIKRTWNGKPLNQNRKEKADLHLLNLWESRLTALNWYREHGKTLGLRAWLDTATAEARNYCPVLSQDQ